MQSQNPQTPAHKGCPVCGFLGDATMQVCPNDGSILTEQTLFLTQQPRQPAGDPRARVGTTTGDHYLLTEFIGEGGMSLVYKAKQLPLERTVAIKLLKRTDDSSDIRFKRFFQEAKAVSSLSHPNIINVFDFGMSSDGAAYMVMEFLEGISLAQFLERGKLIDPTHFVHIFSQACDALEHAHQKGILHRDIKPSNMMLVKRSDDKELVKILDFGIAKLMPWAEQGQQKLTQTGEVFGSPLYMSPEQCLGREIDLRSDIYSLGCVMYEMATGRPPVMGMNILDTMHKQIDEEAPPFSTVRADRKDFERLEPVILKSLEKEPGLRQQSMEELRLKLISALTGPAGRQLSSSSISSLNPLRFLRKKRQRKVVIALAGMLLSVVAAAGTLKLDRLWQNAHPPSWGHLTDSGIAALMQRDYERAELAFKGALEQAEHFAPTDDRLEISLKNLRNVCRAEGKYKQAALLDSRLTKFKRQRLRAQYGGTAASLTQITNLTLAMTSKDSQAKDAGKNEEAADTLTSLASLAGEQGDLSRAERLLRAALDLDEQTFGPRSWQVALKLNDLAFFYLRQDQYAKAEPLIKRALPIMQESLTAETRTGKSGLNSSVLQAGSQVPGATVYEGTAWLADYKRLLKLIERNEQAHEVEGHMQTALKRRSTAANEAK